MSKAFEYTLGLIACAGSGFMFGPLAMHLALIPWVISFAANWSE